MMDSLSKMTALVVGGSGGIGKSISEHLAGECGRLVVHGGHGSPAFDEFARALREKSGGRTEIETLIQDFGTGFCGIGSSEIARKAAESDILVVCYGPFLQKKLDEMDAGDWIKAALHDYALPGILLSAALPKMVARKFGRILLFGGTGTAHRTEFFTNAAYAGAKTGVGTIVESTAASYARFGITCNAILPGFTKTQYTEKIDAVLDAKMPLGRQISADSVADAALFLLKNPDANGVLLRLDRGWSPAF